MQTCMTCSSGARFTKHLTIYYKNYLKFIVNYDWLPTCNNFSYEYLTTLQRNRAKEKPCILREMFSKFIIIILHVKGPLNGCVCTNLHVVQKFVISRSQLLHYRTLATWQSAVKSSITQQFTSLCHEPWVTSSLLVKQLGVHSKQNELAHSYHELFDGEWKCGRVEHDLRVARQQLDDSVQHALEVLRQQLVSLQ